MIIRSFLDEDHVLKQINNWIENIEFFLNRKILKILNLLLTE